MTSQSLANLARVCGGLAELDSRVGAAADTSSGAVDVESIMRALDNFMECVRYLNTRRTGTAMSLESEADVQDALYLMLRPWVKDLVPEEPTGKVASRYVIEDFFSVSAETVIEAKYIRDAAHGKNISKELHDDIETYRHHRGCRHIVFFIYDPDALIPDKAALVRQIEIDRQYAGVALSCRLICKP